MLRNLFLSVIVVTTLLILGGCFVPVNTLVQIGGQMLAKEAMKRRTEPTASLPSVLPSTNSISMENAKTKCEELDFKPKTEKYGECVLKLME